LSQSDSDDGSPTPRLGEKSRIPLPALVLKSRKNLGGPSRHGNCIESDSVNENFSPIRPTTRRCLITIIYIIKTFIYKYFTVVKLKVNFCL
jgi:hypothetical protein